MSATAITTRLAGRDAEVEIDGRRFAVEASAKGGRSCSCPAELVIAALGS